MIGPLGTSDRRLMLADLGGNPYAAVAKIQGEFRARGWLDEDGYAVMIVSTTQERGGSATLATLSAIAPRSFLTRNGTSRREVAQLLASLKR
jgi:hypothetical protein